VSLIANISGCSLYITSADQGSDISRIGIGSHREEVEAIFGNPKGNCETIKDEIHCHYVYKHDCKDSMRDEDKYQIMYADIFTLGLAELFLTPFALIQCGKESTICYAYDNNNKVIKYGIVENEQKDMSCSGSQN
jgi:hypothetical protein